jgi:hypothetical protein
MRFEVLIAVTTRRHIPEDINLYSPYKLTCVSAEYITYIFTVEK